MALPEAIKDCDTCLKLDSTFIKAYIRKANAELLKKDYAACLESLDAAMSNDKDGKHASEIESMRTKAYFGINGNQSDGNKEETLKRAAQNPEVQKILSDPIMREILGQMQSDPRAAAEHMKNPQIAAKSECNILYFGFKNMIHF